jgi:hypothetical protein
VKRKANRERWWRYAEARPGLERAVAGLREVIVQPFTAKYLFPTFVDARSVFAHPLVVIVQPTFSIYALLQSSLHEKWVWQHGSTSLDLLRYTASSVLETFPLPRESKSLESLGKTYYDFRQRLIYSRNEGLTVIYNNFHNPTVVSDDIEKQRSLQRELDLGVAAAYGWTDLKLNHDFHGTEQGLRYTISEDARREVLDRLLVLNHRRHDEEQGGTALSATKTKQGISPRRKAEDDDVETLPDLFDVGRGQA